jgi:general L-amino acid transport system permease protein
VIGIVLATVLGTSIGIARLSANWLLSRLAAVYVEVLRDIPLPLQLLFWYVLMQGLPGARAAWNPLDGVFLSNRGLMLPWIPIGERQLWVLGAAALGVAAVDLVERDHAPAAGAARQGAVRARAMGHLGCRLGDTGE